MSFKTIEDYALDLVLSGARDSIQDDMNEAEEISDEDWPAARALAGRIADYLEENAEEILRTVAAEEEASQAFAAYAASREAAAYPASFLASKREGGRW